MSEPLPGAASDNTHKFTEMHAHTHRQTCKQTANVHTHVVMHEHL